MPQPHKPALGFIFCTLLLDVIGLGIIIPVVPALIRELSGGTLSEAARYGGWLMFAYASMLFLFSPILGGVSDRYGRRPVLLISLLGFGLDYLLLAYAPTIGWLFAGRVIAGATGASFTTASAYVADVSPPENRTQNFGLIGAAAGLGFVIGPVLGGLLGQAGVRVPFFVAAGLTLLNWLYGYFVLPESLPVENRPSFSWKDANPLGSWQLLRRYPVILGLVGAQVLLFVASTAIQSTWTYYTMYKFGWNAAWVGYSLGAVGAVTALVRGLLIRAVIPRLGDRRAVILGLVLTALGFILFAFATQGWMMFVFLVPYGLGGIALPALQSIMSEQVPAQEQGQLQGGLTSLISATAIIGPPLMTNLFSYFSGPHTPVHFPGASFLLGAILTLLSAIWVLRSLASYAPRVPAPYSKPA